MSDFGGWLAGADAERREAGLRREVRTREPADALLDLAGNDYLGLSQAPAVIAAGIEALRTWGAGAQASRLVTGTTSLHEQLEEALARFTGCESGLVFSSGYLANLAAITALSDADTLIVSDALNHASLVDACRLSRGAVTVTPHADLGAIDAALRGRTQSRALVVTESVFSADGDAAGLAALHDVCWGHGAVLVVDEAHAIGTAGLDGHGLAHATGIAGEPEVVLTVTLSKALGSQGGAVLASAAVREQLSQTARPFIFDTGLAPVNAASALAALRLLDADPGLVEGARQGAHHLAELVRAAGFAASEPGGVVVPVVLGSPALAVAGAEVMAAHGVRVGCFRPPSVPAGASRLRLTSRPGLTEADLARVAAGLAAVAALR